MFFIGRSVTPTFWSNALPQGFGATKAEKQMALSLQSQGLVRQKAREIIKQTAVFYTLKAFFLYLSQAKKNLDLQLVPLNPADPGLVAATGQVVADVPATLFVVWGKKSATALDAYLAVNDSATTDQTAADRRLTLPFLLASDEQVFYSPNGIPMAAGITVGSVTTGTGATHSAAADAPSGFVILGA